MTSWSNWPIARQNPREVVGPLAGERDLGLASSVLAEQALMRPSRHSRRSTKKLLTEEARTAQRQVREVGPITPPSKPRSPRRRMVERLLALGIVVLGIGGGVLSGEPAMGTALGLAAGLVIEAALIAGDHVP